MLRFVRKSLPATVILFLVFVYGVIAQQQSQPIDLLREMLKSSRDFETLTYSLVITERMDGVMTVQISETKINREPFKVYIKQLEPKKGLEVLYLEGENDGNALVNPNGFPWMNFNLDPYGSLMRENTHHTLFNSGFAYFAMIVDHLLSKYSAYASSALIQMSDTSWNGIDCYHIVINNPKFRFYDYQVGKDENIINIAKRLKVGEHMILENSSGVSGYYDVDEGDLIKIPNDYAAKMEVFIDKKRMIPLVTKVYDDKGLYEQYEYLKIEINPSLKPEEFTKNYEEYGF
ncbi:MAG: hypothetical protein COA57_09055 [Flavobacteriales bacterium]|nr:MAG: hypothetical protein COA57_09055 [Flavobacteriales bacterium]